ncbi:MAG TPA: NAD(P)-binding domain-containing protein [Myxococcaceae bacterium]|nr:NAD(P)-binding domain-containing protein [Myxococcaceae bacterium]
MSSIGRVCVVGAGPAGLALARAFLAHGVPFDVYERHRDVGGLWDQTNAGSPVYDSAHFISSKTQSHFHDFPMPEEYPDYPSHAQVLAYMRAFADAYRLREHIRFDTGVTSAVPESAGWKVTLSTGEVRPYASLVCANGTNWHPTMPSYPGVFAGEMRHTRTYRSPEELRGKRVLIVGAGNSGADIACDAARTAARAFLSVRRGYHFIPKHIFGKPADVFAAESPRMPKWLEQRVFGALLRLLNGDVRRLGLPRPDHRIFETHPILNTQVLHSLAHGDLKAMPDVERFAGRTVHFKNGATEEIDLVLCATGYDWSIPYVPAETFRWKGQRPDLYMALFSRENPRLYVMGYLETNSGAYRFFDDMADLLARAIAARAEGGEAGRAVDALVTTDQPDLTGGIHFIATDRHATYVDGNAYRKHLRRVRRRLGWPELSPGCYERLRSSGQAGAAA